MLPYPRGPLPPLEPVPSYPPPPAGYPPPAYAAYPSSSSPAYNPSTASYSPTASPYPSSVQPQQSSSPTSLAGVDLSALPLMTGTVRWFNPTKGYGFIAPSDGSPHDAFVHQNQLQSDGFRALERDQIVEFRMRIDPVTGKHIALAVTAPGGGKLPAGRREEDRDGDRDRDSNRDRDRGPPSFRPSEPYPSPAAPHSSADLDAPTYDGRNARPAGVPFCVGVVKSFDVGKGFGFLTQLTTVSGQPGAGDIFVHQSNVHMEGRRELVEGMVLEYVEGVDQKNGKPLAKNVTGRDGSLITRQHVEATMQQGRPHASAYNQPHSQPPTSPHSHPPPSASSSSSSNGRSSHLGSRDLEINSSIQPSTGVWHRGTVLTFDPVKKYGFIKPDGGGENMFLHATRCEVPMDELVKGLTLEYQVGKDQKGKECGVNIRRLRGPAGYGPVGRQRSPHRAAPYARDGRGASPGRARYDEFEARRDNGYERDRGEYRRGYDRRTPPRDYQPPPPAAYPPPPASAYPPPPAAQQPPPPPAAYYDPYRSDPRYAQQAAQPPGSYPPPLQAASAPAGYDPHYPPPPASYYPQPTASVTHPPAAAPAPTAYYGQHTQPPAAPTSATPPYYYAPPLASAATTAALQPPQQYAYPPPPLPAAAAAASAPSATQSAAAFTASANGAASQPNQMLAHLYSLYSTLSATTPASTAAQQPNTAASTAAASAAPATYHYATQPTTTHRPH